jgi:hypothetical protein
MFCVAERQAAGEVNDNEVGFDPRHLDLQPHDRAPAGPEKNIAALDAPDCSRTRRLGLPERQRSFPAERRLSR